MLQLQKMFICICQGDLKKIEIYSMITLRVTLNNKKLLQTSKRESDKGWIYSVPCKSLPFDFRKLDLLGVDDRLFYSPNETDIDIVLESLESYIWN